MTKQERLEKKRNMLKEMKAFDKSVMGEGEKYLVGVDEVGRGPLAGPVVVAAVVLPTDFDELGINDSKKLSEKKREELNHIILEKALAYGFGMMDNEIIDEINILEATKEGMRTAIKAADDMLFEKCGEHIQHVLIDSVNLKGINLPLDHPNKGDSKSLSIAAASIIAKVKRDHMMIEYDKEYPGYDFASNKGYGTKAHYEGIKKLGLTPVHRRTFLKNLDEH